MITTVTRFFFISIVFSAAYLNVNAQELKFGIKGGLNIATLGGDKQNVEPRIGFHAGGFLSVPLVTDFKLQPEIIYSQQGAQADFGGDEIKYDYLNIPVMAKYQLIKNLNVQTGLQLGILLSAKEELRGFEIDLKEATRSTDLSMCFGLGYETDDNIFINVRYNFGFSNTLDIGNDIIDIPNRVIQASLGIAF